VSAGHPGTDCSPVSCEALPADSTTVLPAPLRFLPLHSQADASTDPSTASAPTNIASDYLEVPAPPVPLCEATPASSAHTVNTWSQILGVTAEPTSISLDGTCVPQSLNDNLQSLPEDEKPPQDNAPACPEETPVIFGRWASVVPIGGTTYCQFDDATGLLRALVLPSASQVRERYAQAMAFMRQQANSDMTRHRLGHSISVGSPSLGICGQSCLHNAVLDECPLNDKCPKIAESQPINKVSENNTEGTNTHCVDSSSHADSLDRPKPIVLATDNPDRCDACPCCDPDTRDGRVSLSQSTEVTVAESDKDTINPRANLLPLAINSLHPVRRTQGGRLDAIQSRTLIGR